MVGPLRCIGNTVVLAQPEINVLDDSDLLSHPIQQRENEFGQVIGMAVPTSDGRWAAQSRVIVFERGMIGWPGALHDVVVSEGPFADTVEAIEAAIQAGEAFLNANVAD